MWLGMDIHFQSSSEFKYLLEWFTEKYDEIFQSSSEFKGVNLLQKEGHYHFQSSSEFKRACWAYALYIKYPTFQSSSEFKGN